MKALVFDQPGIENLKVAELKTPKPEKGQVLIKVKMAGVNPIDALVVTVIPANPMPHIPGGEFAGTVEEIGDGVTSLKVGDRVTVYSRMFDGNCDMCLSGRENLCRTGSILSIASNGGFAEYVALDEANCVKIGNEISWEMAASLPIAALTSYHALNQAGLGSGENFVAFGASGNTGLFALQFAKERGATVIAVTRKGWAGEYGADYVVQTDAVQKEIARITSNRMSDVVLNSLGESLWKDSCSVLGTDGRLVCFGVLTGKNVPLDLGSLYAKQWKFIGATGGTRDEFVELVANASRYKIRVWKKFGLYDGAQAILALRSKERDGRIMIEFPD
ncbi:MAG: alcohol dehydrogenase catalytic domain-containing protein [Nitrospirae bacterium]|nr:alcohol dehydrogenase catalytic domain-containing protein [Nitrospirota bacterium]MCL5284387.1 alcohol dehydrogenase catalytic domain-containing protein [Nitrospirota bacterium]